MREIRTDTNVHQWVLDVASAVRLNEGRVFAELVEVKIDNAVRSTLAQRDIAIALERCDIRGWPLRVGLHTCYNGEYRGKRTCEGKRTP